MAKSTKTKIMDPYYGKDSLENQIHETYHRALFFAACGALIAIVISIALFFYIRAREGLWAPSVPRKLEALNSVSETGFYIIPLQAKTTSTVPTTYLTTNGDTLHTGNAIYHWPTNSTSLITRIVVSASQIGASPAATQYFTVSNVRIVRTQTSNVVMFDSTGTGQTSIALTGAGLTNGTFSSWSATLALSADTITVSVTDGSPGATSVKWSGFVEMDLRLS